MSKSILRIILTILMYAGVCVFLFPYFTGRITAGIPFMIFGAGCTVVCGLLAFVVLNQRGDRSRRQDELRRSA